MEDLERCPNTSFERDVLCETEDSFLLSNENMKALRFLHEQVTLLIHKQIEFQLTHSARCCWNDQ